MKYLKIKLTNLLFSIIALSFNTATHAQDRTVEQCWYGAAQYHGVDVYLLYSIAWTESRLNPKAIGKNRNGSFDLGLMQINTIWLPELRKHGITSQALLDPCISIYTGAWILSKNFQRYGKDNWMAIGAYNSNKPSIAHNYARKVYDAHAKIVKATTQQTARN